MQEKCGAFAPCRRRNQTRRDSGEEWTAGGRQQGKTAGGIHKKRVRLCPTLESHVHIYNSCG